jgi:membrane associated rhomboid family serine protease
MTQFRPTGYNSLPTIIKNLLIINALVFFAQYVFRGFVDPETQKPLFENLFALHTYQSDLFRPWQLISHMFMHDGFMHIFGNMLALWMFGSILENIWGPKQFLLFYFLCGVGAALIHLGAFSIESLNYSRSYYSAIVDVPTLGASGAIFGILIAFVYLFPNTYIYIYFFIPMKAKWLGILYFSYELFKALMNSASDNVARWAHVGGAVIGFILVYLWKRNNRQF